MPSVLLFVVIDKVNVYALLSIIIDQIDKAIVGNRKICDFTSSIDDTFPYNLITRISIYWFSLTFT